MALEANEEQYASGFVRDEDGRLIVTNGPVDTAIEGAGAVTIAATSEAEVVAASADRQYLRITNDSDSTLYLALGETAVVNTGIRLATGEYWETTRWTGAVRAQNSAAAGKVLTFVQF